MISVAIFDGRPVKCHGLTHHPSLHEGLHGSTHFGTRGNALSDQLLEVHLNQIVLPGKIGSLQALATPSGTQEDHPGGVRGG